MFSVFAIPAQMSRAYGTRSDGYSEDLDLFCSLFDGSSICIAQLDIWLSLVDGNAAFAHAFGAEPDALPGRKFLEMVHSSCREKVSRQLMSLAQSERARFTDRVMVSGADGVFSVELTGIAVAGDAGQAESIICVLEPEKNEGAQTTRLAKMKKPLTKMDAMVLEGVASGMSTVQLASHLFLSRGGVEYHVSTLMRSLKAANRSALVSKAYSAGLFSIGIWPPRVIPECIE
jgi:DNA-binding NarL/FixJ family response regulator